MRFLALCSSLLLVLLPSAHVSGAIVSIAVGNQSYGATSSDGVNWTENDSIFSPNRIIHDVVVTDLNNAWAVGNMEGGMGLVLRTTNASAAIPTWTRVTGIGVPTVDLFAVHFIDAMTGWVAGDSERIYRTVDGGANWNVVDLGTNNLNSIDFVDAQNGWAVGNGESLWKSTNGGANWTLQTSPYSGTPNFFDVSMVDGLNGWLSGADGRIARTTDGGTNWVAQTTGVMQNLNSISFVDTLNGWAVGNNGRVLRTTNSGTTWTPIVSAAIGTDGLSGVHFVDTLTGWISGPSGRIYGSTDGGLTWTEQFDGDHDFNGISAFQSAPVAAVPEPATLASFSGLLVLLGSGMYRRRARKQN